MRRFLNYLFWSLPFLLRCSVWSRSEARSYPSLSTYVRLPLPTRPSGAIVYEVKRLQRFQGGSGRRTGQCIQVKTALSSGSIGTDGETDGGRRTNYITWRQQFEAKIYQVFRNRVPSRGGYSVSFLHLWARVSLIYFSCKKKKYRVLLCFWISPLFHLSITSLHHQQNLQWSRYWLFIFYL